LSSVDQLRRVPSVALFVQRARAADPGFVLTAENGPPVAEICRRLDGLPLAIDLAAARTPLLPPEALLARLAAAPALPLLTDGARDLPERQQTLRRTLEWSYDLLSSAEQRVFRGFAVFEGGATIEAIEAVTNGMDDAPRSNPEVLSLVASLVDKSLLRRDGAAGGHPRIGILETIREFARERLEASGKGEDAARAHLRHYLALARAAAPELTGAEQVGWFARLDTEHENLRAALGWALASGDLEQGLQLAGSLFRFWHTRGYLSEGRRWLEDLLGLEGTVTPDTHARAFHSAGLLAYAVGDLARAEDLLGQSLVIRRERNEERDIADLLSNLGVIAQDRGDLERAEILLAECLTLDRKLGDRWGLAASLVNSSRLSRLKGDLARSRELQTEALTVVRELGDVRSVAISLSNLGSIARDEGDWETARALSEESLELWREIEEPRGIGVELKNLGLVALELGDPARAEMLIAESVERLHAIDTVQDTLSALEALAQVLIARDARLRAVRLLAAAETLRAGIDTPRPPDEQIARDAAIESARVSLTTESFDAAWKAGAKLSLGEAVTFARETAC
jgi:tetratricopeptide (TPR) repeat protein